MRRRKDQLHQLRARGDPLGGSRELCGVEGRRNAYDQKYRPRSRALADSRQFDRTGRDSYSDQHGGMGHTGPLFPTPKVPYKRIGEPQEIGRAAALLASDDSDYVHGITLFVDGGNRFIRVLKLEARRNMSTKVIPSLEAEWLEADGLCAFASATVSGIRTRRYHGLLVPATTPPGSREWARSLG